LSACSPASRAWQIGLEGAGAAEKRWAFADGRHNRWAADEVEAWPRAAEQARAAPVFRPEWPVAVITAGAAPAAGRAGWKDLQTAPARASLHGYVEHVAGAGHATLLGKSFAAEVVKGIDFVRDALAPAPAMAAG